MRVLLDKLEEKMKDTAVEGTIGSLFAGETACTHDIKQTSRVCMKHLRGGEKEWQLRNAGS